MSRLRRYHQAGNWYFITCVTYRRAPVLIENFDLLERAIAKTQERLRFALHAWVVLPDHFHAIIDSQTSDISAIMQRLKLGFAYHWRVRTGRSRGRIWQNRYWDHIIRGEEDLKRHIDYIHFNPVKHGHAAEPFDWQYSSVRRFCESREDARLLAKRNVLEIDDGFGE